jgi:hypothetical protein
MSAQNLHFTMRYACCQSWRGRLLAIQEKMCKDPANGNQQQVAAWDGSKDN